MSSNRPSGRPSSGSGVPPTSRRSARQQRLASREANRALARASTRGSGGGGGMRGLLIYSAAAVVIAAIVIAGAIILTSGKNNGPAAVGDLPSPNGPLASQITPTDLPTNGRTLGNANAAHTIDIWEDFQCPNCRLFTFTIEPQLIDNYVAKGQAKLVYHDWLVIDSGTGGHESLDAANAALCASDQGKFWPFHDWLFTNQFQEGSGAFTKDRIKGMASMMGGLDLNKFDSCVDSGTHNADVKTESSKPPAGATGTPAVLVDGKLTTSYDYATVSDALNQVLGITPSPSVAASASASSSTSASPAPVSTPAVSATPATTPSASPSAS